MKKNLLFTIVVILTSCTPLGQVSEFLAEDDSMIIEGNPSYVSIADADNGRLHMQLSGIDLIYNKVYLIKKDSDTETGYTKLKTVTLEGIQSGKTNWLSQYASATFQKGDAEFVAVWSCECHDDECSNVNCNRNKWTRFSLAVEHESTTPPDIIDSYPGIDQPVTGSTPEYDTGYPGIEQPVTESTPEYDTGYPGIEQPVTGSTPEYENNYPGIDQPVTGSTPEYDTGYPGIDQITGSSNTQFFDNGAWEERIQFGTSNTNTITHVANNNHKYSSITNGELMLSGCFDTADAPSIWRVSQMNLKDHALMEYDTKSTPGRDGCLSIMMSLDGLDFEHIVPVTDYLLASRTYVHKIYPIPAPYRTENTFVAVVAWGCGALKGSSAQAQCDGEQRYINNFCTRAETDSC